MASPTFSRAGGIPKEECPSSVSSASEQLLLSVQPTLGRVVASVLGASHPDLDDAIQQSSLALLRAAPAFRGECHPAGYASRIALRVALRMRGKSRREWSRRADLESCGVDRDRYVERDPAESTERRQLLHTLLATLPPEQCEALTLRAVLDWSLEEVAGAMGVPSNTVRSRVRLAREALKRRIASSPLADALDTED